MLTRKHLEKVAEIIRDTFGDDVSTEYAPFKLVEKFADYFGAENPRFDREKFLYACGLDVD